MGIILPEEQHTSKVVLWPAHAYVCTHTQELADTNLHTHTQKNRECKEECTAAFEMKALFKMSGLYCGCRERMLRSNELGALEREDSDSTNRNAE